MRAGLLRHRITIQQPDFISDSHGGQIPRPAPVGNGTGWKDVATVSAQVSPMRGNESFVHRQLQDSITHKIVIRYHSGVLAKQRIKFGSRVFNIRQVKDLDERRIMMELECDEGAGT